MEVNKHKDIKVMKMIKAQAAAHEKEINPALMLSEESIWLSFSVSASISLMSLSLVLYVLICSGVALHQSTFH